MYSVKLQLFSMNINWNWKHFDQNTHLQALLYQTLLQTETYWNLTLPNLRRVNKRTGLLFLINCIFSEMFNLLYLHCTVSDVLSSTDWQCLRKKKRKKKKVLAWDQIKVYCCHFLGGSLKKLLLKFQAGPSFITIHSFAGICQVSPKDSIWMNET